MDEPQSLKPRYRTMWLGMLAGLASMTLAWTLHRMLEASQRLPGDTVFTDHSDSPMWLLIQVVDLAGGVAAGMAAAHWSQRWSWRAVAGILAVLVVNGMMATPSSRDAFRMLLSMLASPVGLLLGASYYRYRERTQPDVHVLPARVDHAQVPDTPYSEAAVVVALSFGYFILGSTIAVFSQSSAQAFSDNSLLAIVVLELMLGACALGVLYARLSATDLAAAAVLERCANWRRLVYVDGGLQCAVHRFCIGRSDAAGSTPAGRAAFDGRVIVAVAGQWRV